MKPKSEIKPVDLERMEEWLLSLLAEDSGFKDYYTFRKRHLLDAMSVGVPQQDYWELVGRVKEIKQIASTAQDFFKKREAQKAKQGEKQKAKK